jgi:drug/metabolite transporter (DMT)-like permease
VIDQNFYYAGLKFTGPTFACAMSNILPAMTFVLAVIFRWWRTCTFETIEL